MYCEIGDRMIIGRISRGKSSLTAAEVPALAGNNGGFESLYGEDGEERDGQKH